MVPNSTNVSREPTVGWDGTEGEVDHDGVRRSTPSISLETVQRVIDSIERPSPARNELNRHAGTNLYASLFVLEVLERTGNERDVLRAMLNFVQRAPELTGTDLEAPLLAAASRLIAHGIAGKDKHRLMGMVEMQHGSADGAAAEVMRATFYASFDNDEASPTGRVEDDRSCSHATIADTAGRPLGQVYRHVQSMASALDRCSEFDASEKAAEHAAHFAEPLARGAQRDRGGRAQ